MTLEAVKCPAFTALWRGIYFTHVWKCVQDLHSTWKGWETIRESLSSRHYVDERPKLLPRSQTSDRFELRTQVEEV